MNKYAVDQKTIGDAVAKGGLLVVAQWEAKEGQADTVAGILDRFLPEAQRDPGSQLFLIGRNKENPAQFAVLRDFVYEAYYTQPQVWKLIDYQFHATDHEGPRMKPFDEAVIAKVRTKPVYFRKA